MSQGLNKDWFEQEVMRRSLSELQVSLGKAADVPLSHRPAVLRDLRSSLRRLQAVRQHLSDDELVLVDNASRVVRIMAGLEDLGRKRVKQKVGIMLQAMGPGNAANISPKESSSGLGI